MRPVARGFTLVELLVAIALLGLLLTAAFGSLTLGARSWEAAINRAERSHELRSSLEFLRRQFTHLIPLSRHDGRQRVIAFRGGRDSVQFVAPAPEAAGAAGMIAVGLQVERRADSVGIWLTVAPVDPGAEQWLGAAPARRSLLVDGLDDVAIAYLGAPRDDDEIAWRATWLAEAERYPQAVRIAVAGGAGWPELVFPVHAEQLL